jgi:hypothetical protein
MIGSGGSVLGEENINVNLAIGVDEEPRKSTLTNFGEIPAIESLFS